MKTPLKKNLFSKIITSGTYKVWCGNAFYIGSSKDLDKRRQDHALQLKRGNHHSKKLQAAFDALPDPQMAEFEVVEEMPRTTVEVLRAAEQKLLDDLFDAPGCCNTSRTSIGATNPNPKLRLRWQDPDFRAYMREMSLQPPSTQTRSKMSKAKSGANNPNARAVELVFKGKTYKFATATEAAIHFKVTQQTMFNWLSGIHAWPGSNPRRMPRSRETARLIGLTGRFV